MKLLLIFCTQLFPPLLSIYRPWFHRYNISSLQFQTFLTQINSSLVDSNMLVRCIVLSLDRFESQTEDVKGESPLLIFSLQTNLLFSSLLTDPSLCAHQWWRYCQNAACCPTWPEWTTGCPSFSDSSTSSTCRPSHRSLAQDISLRFRVNALDADSFPSPLAVPAGERQLSEHQPGDPDAGQKKGQAALLPQRPAGEGVRREVPGLPAQQLPQPAALLAASLPQQGQGQHLSGEREWPQRSPGCCGAAVSLLPGQM